MKLKELIEDLQLPQQQTIEFNNYDEYVKFMESKTNDTDSFYHEQIQAADGNEYDIVTLVSDFASHPGGVSPHAAETPEEVTGYTEIEWEVIYYGTGDHDTDTNFWVKSGEVELSQKANAWIDGILAEKMDEIQSEPPDDRY